MAGSEPSMRVSKGRIPEGTDVYVKNRFDERLQPATVIGYISHTNAYLCNMGRTVQAAPAELVVLPVPKFTSVEEADAWMESQ